MSLAQKTIHTTKKDKQKAFSLKLYLSKAYDRVSWTFVRLLMIKIGVALEVVKWIMGCLQSTSFAVIINWSASNFFNPTRGIRQGRPLSPFLFLLVVEALSKIIHKAKSDGAIKGI